MGDVAARVSARGDWLGLDAFPRIDERFESALRRARSSGAPALVSLTAALDAATDPTALVAAARRAGEQWFCMEQPDRDGSAIAGLGCTRGLEAHGQDRFAAVAAHWRALVAGAILDDHPGPPGSGLIALGGFAFASDGGGSHAWEGFAPASLIVP